jgi:ATP-binding cassette subfamily B protein
MSMQGNWHSMRSLTKDASVKDVRLKDGTTRRVLGYAGPYRAAITAFVALNVVEALLVVATPLILRSLIDDGVITGDRSVVIRDRIGLRRRDPGRAMVLLADRRGPDL